jgi:hypothetical protein
MKSWTNVHPFGNMSFSHSTWPVMLVPYNLPPWMCMKQPYFMLRLIIPGPSAPGQNIDVYLMPLVTLQKFLEFWTVSNCPEIAKNRLEKGPGGFF